MSETFVVFARREAQEPLTRIGRVTVPAGGSLEKRVREEHGEDWIELVAIPDRAIEWAIVKGDDE